MKTALILTALFIGLVIIPPANAQYRQNLPAVLETQPVDSDNWQLGNNINQNHQTTFNPNLAMQYQHAGSPKILILLGRKLGSELSEWQADSRDTISTINRAYQGPHQSKDSRDTFRMTENRKVITTNISPGMQAFYKGFSEHLQAANIGMVSYDSILRQAQQKNELSGSIDRSQDLRKVEADAILDNVDILVEILEAGSINVLGVNVDKVRVNVTRMDTFERLSQHIGQGPEYYRIDEQWVAGKNGYEQSATVYLQHADVGYQIAGQLLPKALSRPFHKTSINTHQQPSTSPPSSRQKRVLPPKGKN